MASKKKTYEGVPDGGQFNGQDISISFNDDSNEWEAKVLGKGRVIASHPKFGVLTSYLRMEAQEQEEVAA